jgi:hypothetical protein
MRARVARLFAALFACVAFVSLSACGNGGVPPRPADDAKHESWVEPIFGRAADFAMAVNIRRVRDDPTFAGTEEQRRAMKDVDATIWRALFECDSISLEGIVLDWRKPWDSMQWIAIARGEPVDLAPDALRMSGGAAIFQFVQKTPAGVAIYAVPSDRNHEALFVFPGGTWVLVSNGLLERVAKSSQPPPPLDFDPDPMVSAFMSSALLHAGASMGEVHDKEALDGIDFAVTELDAPRGDDAITLAMKLVYLDAAFAKEAERAIDDELQRLTSKAKEQGGDAAALMVLLRAALQVTRDGRVVKIDLRVPRVLVEKAAKWGD